MGSKETSVAIFGEWNDSDDDNDDDVNELSFNFDDIYNHNINNDDGDFRVVRTPSTAGTSPFDERNNKNLFKQENERKKKGNDINNVNNGIDGDDGNDVNVDSGEINLDD